MKFHVEITKWTLTGYQDKVCCSVDIEATTAKEAMQAVLDHYIIDPAPREIAEIRKCTETHFEGFSGDKGQFSYDIYPCEEE